MCRVTFSSHYETFNQIVKSAPATLEPICVISYSIKSHSVIVVEVKLVVVFELEPAVIVAVACVVPFTESVTIKLAPVGATSRYAENLASVASCVALKLEITQVYIVPVTSSVSRVVTLPPPPALDITPLPSIVIVEPSTLTPQRTVVDDVGRE